MKTPLQELQKALGPNVLTDKDSLFRASFDALKLSFLPEAVIRITEEDQVAKTLLLANKYKIPVTTRGAGSSLTGSAAPVRGGWVIDLTPLNSIKIDPLKRLAFVQTGAITEEIRKAAQFHGLTYPPDPSSKAFCTIGGNIACNAGGLSCVKYGVTRDYVVALEGYLPTGEKVIWGKPLRKYASGYNLRDLWIGSEGTLGVITHAVLRLIPKPETKWTCLAAFVNEKQSLGAALSLLETKVTPSIFEFLDRLSVTGAEKKSGQKLFPDKPGHALLLIELDGLAERILHDKEIILHWAKRHAVAYHEAKTADEAEALWQVRRQCSPAMFEHGDSKLNEDIVIPLDKMYALVDFIEKLSAKTKLKIPTFGHAGDGNLHVNIMYQQSDKQQVKNAELAVDALMHEVVRLGGAITGEHGIGLAKSAFLKLQHSEPEIKAMLAIKHALDPHNILNPGKIFEPFQPWEHEPVSFKLPWDY